MTTDTLTTLANRLARQGFKTTGKVATDRDTFRVYVYAIQWKSQDTIRNHVESAGLVLCGYAVDVSGLYLRVRTP